MRSKPLIFSESFPEQYQDTLIIKSFLKDGNVDFGKSDTKSEPCKTYYISHEYKGQELELKAKNCEEKIIIENVYNNRDDWCFLVNYFGQIIFLLTLSIGEVQSEN